MKIVWGLFISVMILFANGDDKLIIDSNNFESDDSKGMAVFTGDVKMVRIKDTLNANKVVVYLSNSGNKNKKKEATKYVATGKVTFEIFTALKHYEGRGDEVIYYPQKQQYEINGNGYLKDISEDKTLSGDTIFIDQTSGNANVKGTKDRPVRFILNIESKKNENN